MLMSSENPLIKNNLVKLITKKRLAVFLDIDGTLIDFANKPNEIIVPKNLKHLLYYLNNKVDGTLALISGRMIVDIERIFNPLKFYSSGSHGLEFKDSFERYIIFNNKNIPKKIKKELSNFAKTYPGSFIEEKKFSIAFHYRNIPNIKLKALKAISNFTHKSNYKILQGNHVIELIPANINKGKAIAYFMKKPLFSKKIPLYIGDDYTDEFGFKFINDIGGFSVKVGNEKNTSANFFTRDTRTVHNILKFILNKSDKIRC